MRKTREDPNLKGFGTLERGAFVAPWPSWECPSNPGIEKINVNWARGVPAALHYLARELNDILYAQRYAIRSESIESRFRACVHWLKHLSQRPRSSWPDSLSNMGHDDFQRYADELCETASRLAGGRLTNNVTLFSLASQFRLTVKEGWSTGLLRGKNRPDFEQRLKGWRKDGNEKNKEIPYSDSEWGRILNVAIKGIATGRGSSLSDERAYIGACCLMVALTVPANRSSLTLINEDHLEHDEELGPNPQLVVTKNRPKKSTKRFPVEQAPISIQKYKSHLKRIFSENISFNRLHKVSDSAGRPLFIIQKFSKEGTRANGPTWQRLDTAVIRHCIEELRIRYPITKDNGEPLNVCLSLVRKTLVNRIPKTSDPSDKQRAVGHKNIQTTVTNYEAVTGEMHFRHSLGLSAISAALSGSNALLIAAAQATEISKILLTRLARGLNRTFVASCTDPLDGEKAPHNGKPCRQTFGCFTCANLAVTPDDLYRLASLRKRITDDIASGNLTPDAIEYYQSIVAIIEQDIFPIFEPRHVRAAVRRAEKSLHPLWAIFKLD